MNDLSRRDRDILKINNNWSRIMIKDNELFAIENSPANPENTGHYLSKGLVFDIDMQAEKSLYNTGNIYR